MTEDHSTTHSVSVEAARPRRIPFIKGSDRVQEVALTFDDGPHPIYTAQILHVLQTYHVKATFFCMGQQVQQYPDLVRQMHQAGHVVANHSMSHPNFTALTPTEVFTQLQQASDAIEQTVGTRPTLFRPPYGAFTEQVQQQVFQMEMDVVLWDIDTNDWRCPGVEAIVSAVMEYAVNGSVILMHDANGDRSQSVAALPRIIQGLQERGLRLMTVPHLIDDTSPK